MAQVSDDASLTLIHSLEDATTVLNRLVHLVDEIRALSSNDSPLSTEEDYETQVNPRIEEATIKYQLLAGFLQNHRGHEKEFRTIQRTFVNTMQDLQQVQREANKKRETLIDAGMMI
jgi:hypothetical protein